MPTVILLNNDQMGHGDAELGRRVLKTYLQKLPAMKGLDAICFYNAGVKLVAPDSPVLGELQMLHDRGIDLLPCGTCVTAYGIESPLVPPSSMDDLIREMGSARSVITL